MKVVFQIVLGTLGGIIPMTLFSYLMAYLVKEQFKEPVLLAKFLSRASVINDSFFSHFTGWVIHCTIGLFFVIVYHFLWQLTAIEPTIMNGVVMGFFSGVIGISGWAFIFKIHPDPPSVDLGKHYLQLMVAHILFGIGSAMGYLLPA